MEKELHKLQFLCSKREYAEADILEKLRRDSFSKEDAAKILQALISGGYVSQKRYAEAFVRDKSALEGWGAKKIAYRLKLKGIDTETISEAMLTIDTSRAEEKLRQLLKNKWRLLSKEEDMEKRIMKTVRFAMSRGYDYEEVRKILLNFRKCES